MNNNSGKVIIITFGILLVIGLLMLQTCEGPPSKESPNSFRIVIKAACPIALNEQEFNKDMEYLARIFSVGDSQDKFYIPNLSLVRIDSPVPSINDSASFDIPFGLMHYFKTSLVQGSQFRELRTEEEDSYFSKPDNDPCFKDFQLKALRAHDKDTIIESPCERANEFVISPSAINKDCPNKYWPDVASLKKHLEIQFANQPPQEQIIIYFLCGAKESGAKQPLAQDSDRDNVPDSTDDCPNEPGRANCNGCPDSDFDLIPDKDDICPDEPGLKKLGGCKETIDQADGDNDGILNQNDKCPNEAGNIACGGCPDTDSDGVCDDIDKCKNIKGLASNSGCPPKRPKIVHNNNAGKFTVENFEKSSMKLKVFITTRDNEKYEITPEEDTFPANKKEFNKLFTTLDNAGSDLTIHYTVLDKSTNQVLSEITLKHQSLVCISPTECGLLDPNIDDKTTTSNDE